MPNRKGLEKGPPGLGRNLSISVPGPYSINLGFGRPWGTRVEHSGREWERKRQFSWSSGRDPRQSSPRSTTATASDSQDNISLYADKYSIGSSGRYSGFNSPLYSSGFVSMGQSAVIDLLDETSCPIIWDVRQSPKTVSTSRIIAQPHEQNALSFPFTSTAAGHIRILSEHFPWSIELGPESRAITASDALYALYDFLQKDFDDGIWGMLGGRTKDIERAWKRRSDTDEKPKNVDWLGKYYMFKGFYRDDSFVRRRLQPGASVISETWLVSFGKH